MKKMNVVVGLLIFAGMAGRAAAAPAAGETLAARYSDGDYYLAKIVSVKGKAYQVRYVGDGDSMTVTASDLVPLSRRQSFTVNERVLAVWPDKHLKFYPGTVVKVEAKGFLIKWDDGSPPTLTAGERIFSGRLASKAPPPRSSRVTASTGPSNESPLRLNGQIVGSVTKQLQVRLNGQIVGGFEANGYVRKDGQIIGRLESGSNFRKGCCIVGSIDGNGNVRKDGQIVGKIEAGGQVRKGCCIVGEAKGLSKLHIAAIYFFYFLD